MKRWVLWMLVFAALTVGGKVMLDYHLDTHAATKFIVADALCILVATVALLVTALEMP